jgi:hypothetical protein
VWRDGSRGGRGARKEEGGGRMLRERLTGRDLIFHLLITFEAISFAAIVHATEYCVCPEYSRHRVASHDLELVLEMELVLERVKDLVLLRFFVTSRHSAS